MASGVGSTLWSAIDDSFVGLPIILTGIEFLLGTLTSNVGLLWLFLGHLILVPSMLNLANSVVGQSDPVDYFQQWFIKGLGFVSLAVLWIVGSLAWTGEEQDAGPKSVWIAIFFGAFGFLVFPFLTNKMSGLKPSGSSPNCQMLPAIADKTARYTIFTSWAAHITFFFAFVATNAFWVYNLPEPVLKDSLTDPKLDAARRVKLDEKVQNRKTLSASIGAIAVVLLLILLVIRWRSGDCEPSIVHSLMPIALCGFYAFLWFRLIVKRCGVNPVDILGIVQGMVDPSLQEKPIVCMAEKDT